MTDLPTKDEIVERVADVLRTSENRIWDYGETSKAALDALTVPDLLALLRERGYRVQTVWHDHGTDYIIETDIKVRGEFIPEAAPDD